MAKRSIEIIISAENRTGAALEAAKADVARYADDVKRIQQNVRLGGEAFGGGLGRAEAGLASSSARARDLEDANRLAAFERVRSDARSAAESEAYAINARMGKEQYDAIRASVGATDELAGSTRKVAEAVGQGATKMSDMEGAALRLGSALAIAKVAVAGIGAGLDLGSAALRGEDMGEAAAKAMVSVAKSVPLAGQLVEPGGNFAKALHDRLAGTGPEWQARVDKKNAAENEDREKTAADQKAFAEQQLAWAKEFNDRWNAEDERKNKMAQASREASVKFEEEATREAANAEYNNILATAAAKGDALAEAAKTRKEDNARYRRESFEGLQDEAMTAAEKAAGATSGIARRGGYSAVSAFDRGFLTRAPGSTFDESRAKHEETTAKATEKTAKGVEKTAKAVETLTERQELLFRELLIALRPGKIINF